jgi:hypothetical protein
MLRIDGRRKIKSKRSGEDKREMQIVRTFDKLFHSVFLIVLRIRNVNRHKGINLFFQIFPVVETTDKKGEKCDNNQRVGTRLHYACHRSVYFHFYEVVP